MANAQLVKFKRKTTEEIQDLPIEDGSLIYNVDNGKTYMDYDSERIQTGGVGGEVVVNEEDVNDDTKLIIEDGDLDFQNNEMPIVTLTEAEYEALTTKDPNVYYFIIEE